MTEISRIFDYTNGIPVRTVTINNEPWFVAADICNALGIARQQDATRYLDADERQTIDIRTVSRSQTFPLTSTNPAVTLVNEPGMYTLILRSRKPKPRRSSAGSPTTCSPPSAPTADTSHPGPPETNSPAWSTSAKPNST